MRRNHREQAELRLFRSIPEHVTSQPNLRYGLTLVELLIVLAIISLLIQLGLPAIEMARQSARKAQCANNLRQLAVAAQIHVAATGRLPTGGWSWRWVGDPARGNGAEQPGGWIFNLLPYLENDVIRQHSLAEQDDQRRRKAVEMEGMAIPILNCPSRRLSKAYLRTIPYAALNSLVAETDARSDYAANGGDFYTNLGPGPRDYAEADSRGYEWPEQIRRATGVIFCRSLIRPKDITDGLSNTYLFGEKYLCRANYENGADHGDDLSMYQGDDMDIVRWTSPTISDHSKGFTNRPNLPRQDASSFVTAYAFGSAHPSGWHVARCDGSVRLSKYQIDAEVHRRLGNRKDGQVAER